MKLLIIAGPHEADRIRRAAVAAGVEAAAVEPGEGLSGWITATRPDLIVLASQVVSANPNVALAKVRSVPRGRVPIFLLGDADEESRLRDLADGVFVRPLVPDALVAKVKDAVARAALRSGDDPPPGPHDSGSQGSKAGTGRHAAPPSRPHANPGSGPHATPASGPHATTASGFRSVAAVVAARADDSGHMQSTPVTPPPDDARADSGGGASARRSTSTPTWTPTLKPLVAVRPAPGLFAALSDDIEADFDAEIRDVVRAVGALRPARAGSPPDTAVSTGLAPPRASENEAAAESALEELKDETSQRTLELPLMVSAALVQPGRAPVTEDDSEADRALVLARYALVMAGDYFQILGISRNAAAPDIQDAYDQAMSDLSADTLHPGVTAGLRAEISEARVVLTEAARLLMDDGLRGQYRQHLPPLPVASAVPPASRSPSLSETSTVAPAPAPTAMSTPADVEDAGS